jgi:hypothetical protein
MKRLAALIIALVLAVAAPSARAEKLHGCVMTPGFPEPTLSVRGMECRAGLRVFHKLFREHPGADGLGFNVTGHFTTTGRTGRLPDRLRHFSCAVRYGPGTGRNRGGIKLTVACHARGRIAFRYSEQQDNE